MHVHGPQRMNAMLVWPCNLSDSAHQLLSEACIADLVCVFPRNLVPQGTQTSTGISFLHGGSLAAISWCARDRRSIKSTYDEGSICDARFPQNLLQACAR